jgi:hypothetical protein
LVLASCVHIAIDWIIIGLHHSVCLAASNRFGKYENCGIA